MPLDPYWSDDTVSLYVGDCRAVLAEMPDASVDACVTDPPYEYRFMGREWDASGVAFDPAVWAECLRVLKPGGHLLAFGAPRTYHRLACAIENAGFQIRDSIHWITGSGFPKGQDIAKVIDRQRLDRDEVLQVTTWLKARRDAAGWTTARMDALFGFNGMAGHWTSLTSKAAAVPTLEQWDTLREAMGFDDAEVRPLVAKLNGRKGALGEAWTQREVVGEAYRVRRPSDVQIAALSDGAYAVTAPVRDEARQWEGWSTSLKPAHEPIILARKSTGFNTTVANVLEYGTGALNIAACRVEPTGESRPRVGEASQGRRYIDKGGTDFAPLPGVRGGAPEGRWPTNLVFSHSALCVEDGPCEPDCSVAELDRQSGWTPSNSRAEKGNGMGYHGAKGRRGGWVGDTGGGASRFFPVFRYEAKAPASERPKLPDGTAWPTVKPVALMRWLVRLVTPPNGVVLDPFAGSGTTAEACIVEGFRCVLIDQDPVAVELIRERLRKPLQPALDLLSEGSDAP
ncbi:DNA methyltransferase [Nonomuraea sp. NPDC050202]|uniref:DNA methyltransferase n=1 Tax=Nonomuraea sp. NPDC050202 TaxID=3155035 RepID=UPI0033DF0799